MSTSFIRRLASTDPPLPMRRGRAGVGATSAHQQHTSPSRSVNDSPPSPRRFPSFLVAFMSLFVGFGRFHSPLITPLADTTPTSSNRYAATPSPTAHQNVF